MFDIVSLPEEWEIRNTQSGGVYSIMDLPQGLHLWSPPSPASWSWFEYWASFLGFLIMSPKTSTAYHV